MLQFAWVAGAGIVEVQVVGTSRLLASFGHTRVIKFGDLAAVAGAGAVPQAGAVGFYPATS